MYCLPTAYVRCAHSQSSLLWSSLPHYSESVYSGTWVRVDLRSYGTQLEPSSNDVSVEPAPHHQFLFTTRFRQHSRHTQHTWHMWHMQHAIAFAPSTCVDHNLETYLSWRVFPLQYKTQKACGTEINGEFHCHVRYTYTKQEYINVRYKKSSSQKGGNTQYTK